ncbi:MAG: hypothetical protein NPIRA02_20350 [Nitrospirales bacterium]|nr:MAG: hypothetical protein NPIRA02_20350 [Nitrospirales bacterium]
MNSANDFSAFLRDFNEVDLNHYTCFAGEFRDQRLEAGAMAEAGFWNTVVNLCIDERLRREGEVRRLEYMYRTGVDLEDEAED